MRRGIQNSWCIVRTQQLIDLAAKVGIVRAGARQEPFACQVRQSQRFSEKPFQKQPSFAMQGASPDALGGALSTGQRSCDLTAMPKMRLQA
jgi:hypothetical protein